MFSHIGVPGVTGLLLRDLNANPLDFSDGGAMTARRQEMSAILDSTNPDFTAFYRRGGKMIVTIGTNDTLASPGAQLDFYQSVIDKMGTESVDKFARFFVIPQAGHGLTGANYSIDGDGKTIPVGPVPNTYDRLGILMSWVEKNAAPGKSLTITSGERSLPLCSYPAYPKYVSGPASAADSYTCGLPD
jgi:feruloyl esterase